MSLQRPKNDKLECLSIIMAFFPLGHIELETLAWVLMAAGQPGSEWHSGTAAEATLQRTLAAKAAQQRP